MDMFYALAEPKRRSIIEMLASQGELSVSTIASRFRISPPAVSQHLKVLREANLIHMEKRAQQRMYRINPEGVRELEAYINSDLVAKWWGTRDMRMTVESLDVRPGGTWRILHVDPEGNEHRFSGEFREVVPPRRIVRTFTYERYPNSIVDETLHFEEQPSDKTKQTTTSYFPSLEALKGMTSTGVERGSTESLERLAELVEN